MKISNEQLAALQQTEALRNKPAASQGFDALLAGELANRPTQGVTSTETASTAHLQHTADINSAAVLKDDSALSSDIQTATQQIDNIFSSMEAYASTLGAPQPDRLKAAYALLENMTTQVAGLRNAYPDMKEANPVLASLVNDLDVLTTTEMFKFNRGDYL